MYNQIDIQPQNIKSCNQSPTHHPVDVGLHAQPGLSGHITLTSIIYTSTYKFKASLFRHDRRTAPKFGTHVWIETSLALTKKNWPTPPQRGLGVIYWCLWHVACGMFVGGWFVAWFKPVVDRKLLERLMSPSPKSQVMFASAFSWIGDFFRIFGIHIFQVMASLVNLV